MDTHHVKVSVLDLITSYLIRAFRMLLGSKYSVRPIFERIRKRSFFAFPADPYGESYIGLIVIASDCLWPWSPKEVGESVLRAFLAFLKWFDRTFGNGGKPKLLGIAILFVGSITRGAYVSRPTPLLDYLKRCGIEVDYGLAMYLLRHDIKVMTRDVRSFNRWFRMWLRNPEQLINEVFGSLENFLIRAKDRLIHSIRFFFNNLSKWIARFAEVRERTCIEKGVEPFGKLRETIEYLKTVSSILAMYAQSPI